MTSARDAVPDHLRGQTRFQWLTRLGFFGRGMLYILIAVLAVGTGRTEDVTGALEYLGHGRGWFLLIGIAAGLTAYGLWRLADAAFGTESGTATAKAKRKRLGAAGIGVIYLYLAFKTVRILVAGRVGTLTAQGGASKALHLPGGQIVMFLVAVAMLAAAAIQLHKVHRCSFLDPLAGPARAPWIKLMGRIGYAARGVVFFVLAILFARAALEGRMHGAGGLEQALDFLRGPLLYGVAFGLAVFGAFSIVEALFRRIHAPPESEQIKQAVKEQITG